MLHKTDCKNMKFALVGAMAKNKFEKITKEDFFDVYKHVAHEAFLYGAESGAEKTGLWMLTFLDQMNSRIGDMNKAFIILLDCGFTMYNLVLDVKGRYGRGHTTKSIREDSIGLYKEKVKLFQDHFRNQKDASHYHLNALTALVDLIDLANCTGTYEMDDAETKIEKLRGKLESIPNFLSALLKYHIALFKVFSCDVHDAKQYLLNAYNSLKVYIIQYTSPSAYCFNVIHGKYY